MKQRYRSAQRVINTLTDERYYEFTLTGKFEDVLGTHADIQWHSVRGRRSLPHQNHAENPEDPPHVNPKPPEVHIFNDRKEQKPIHQEKPAGL